MADTKISALPASTTPLAGTEVLPIVQSGATVKVSVANLTAGRVISANGVTFPATASLSSDPNTLDDYEEGTWTPGQGSGVTVIGTYSSSGTYTKVGRLVTVQFVVAGSTSIAVTSGANFITGLPFAGSSGVYFIGSALNGAATFSSNPIVLDSIIYSAEAVTATTAIYGTITYMV